MTNRNDQTLAPSSMGHEYSDKRHLDTHYLACQPEYEAMLKSVGLQKGWHVLDAGCGSGSFLPLMSQLVGPSGQIDAIDLAPENIERVKTDQDKNVFACQVKAQLGTITDLPYEDDQFDGIWCAATAQYLNDEELNQTFSEFKRVLKPNGITLHIEQPEYTDDMSLYEQFIRDWDAYNNNEPYWSKMHDIHPQDLMADCGFQRDHFMQIGARAVNDLDDGKQKVPTFIEIDCFNGQLISFDQCNAGLTSINH